MLEETGIRLCNFLIAGIIDENTFAGCSTQIDEYSWKVKNRLLGVFQVRFPSVQGDSMSKVLGEQAFFGAGDKYKGEIGVVLANMRELGDKMFPNATDA